MNQQIIAPVAKRSPVLPLAVGLLAALAYGAGVVTSTLVASNTGQAVRPAPVTISAPGSTTHRVVSGPNEY